MQPQAHQTYSDMDGEEESNAPTLILRTIDADASAALANGGSPEAVVAIELNFNAFADDVPPTQHAKRIARQHDPSIQDFADQALEVSALRAELKRLHRDFDALRQTVRLREAQVRSLREQLASARAQAAGAPYAVEAAPSEISEVTLDLSASPPVEVGTADVIPPPRTAAATPAPTLLEVATPAHDGSSTAVLEKRPIADPAATTNKPPKVEAGPATTTNKPPKVEADPATTTNKPPKAEADPAASAPGRKLIPEGLVGEPVLLNRDIITIGRTKQNDICILSRAVSRDHARLLLSINSVTLFDMGSENGCFVNGERVKRHKLRDGDVVRIGDRAYRFADHVNNAQRNRAISSKA